MAEVNAMVERGGDAISRTNNDAACVDLPRDLARRRRDEARAAFLAMLDPADHDLVEAISTEIGCNHPAGRGIKIPYALEMARAAITSIRALAQGGQSE